MNEGGYLRDSDHKKKYEWELSLKMETVEQLELNGRSSLRDNADKRKDEREA